MSLVEVHGSSPWQFQRSNPHQEL